MHFIRLLTGLVILFPLALSSPLSPRNGGTSLGPEDTNDVVNTDDVLSPGGAANILGGLDVSGLPPASADGVPNRPGGDGGRGAGGNEGGFYGSLYYPQASEARPAVTPEVAPNTQGWESNAPASNVWDGATPAASHARSPHTSPTTAGVWTGSYAQPTGSAKPLVARGGSSPSHSSSSWTLPSSSYTDVQLLNLALDLQHLLQAFYAHLALDYDIRAFVNIGYPSWVRNRFLQIQVFPDAHIGALVDVIIQIGGKPVRGGCAYYFDDRAVIELIAMAELLETAAVSIYGNILPLLDSRVSVKILADIMATHARRAAWINAVVRGSSAWNTAFETPLSIDLALSLISSFIIPGTCPSANTGLLPIPISSSASAGLTIPASATAGLTASVSISLFDSSLSASLDLDNLHVVFMVGADIYYQPLLYVEWVTQRRSQFSGSVTVPLELSATGFVYVLVVQGQVGVDIASVSIDAQVIVTGPVLVEFPFDSTGASVRVGVEVDASLRL